MNMEGWIREERIETMIIYSRWNTKKSLTGWIMFPPPSWHPIQACPNNVAPFCISTLCATAASMRKILTLTKRKCSSTIRITNWVISVKVRAMNCVGLGTWGVADRGQGDDCSNKRWKQVLEMRYFNLFDRFELWRSLICITLWKPSFFFFFNSLSWQQLIWFIDAQNGERRRLERVTYYLYKERTRDVAARRHCRKNLHFLCVLVVWDWNWSAPSSRKTS